MGPLHLELKWYYGVEDDQEFLMCGVIWMAMGSYLMQKNRHIWHWRREYGVGYPWVEIKDSVYNTSLHDDLLRHMHHR